MAKHLVICLAGERPQVVTCGLRLLHDEAAIDTGELRVLTTRRGRETADDKGLHKKLNEMDKDVGTSWTTCKRDQMPEHMVPKCPITDLNNAGDAAAFADWVVAQVREATDDQDVVVHALMGGGRQTMGAYLLSAMTWFARPSDSLHHVLMSTDAEPSDDEVWGTGKDETLAGEVFLVPIEFPRWGDLLSRTAIPYRGACTVDAHAWQELVESTGGDPEAQRVVEEARRFECAEKGQSYQGIARFLDLLCDPDPAHFQVVLHRGTDETGPLLFVRHCRQEQGGHAGAAVTVPLERRCAALYSFLVRHSNLALKGQAREVPTAGREPRSISLGGCWRPSRHRSGAEDSGWEHLLDKHLRATHWYEPEARARVSSPQTSSALHRAFGAVLGAVLAPPWTRLRQDGVHAVNVKPEFYREVP